MHAHLSKYSVAFPATLSPVYNLSSSSLFPSLSPDHHIPSTEQVEALAELSQSFPDILSAPMARCNSPELLRSPPFSLQDFQQLVSDAFDLPPNDASPRDLHSPFPSLPPLPVSASVEQRPLTLYAPQPSASFDENHPSDRPSRPRTPFQIFKSIRTRASALLRPTPPSPSSPLPPLPLHLSSESTPIPSPRPSTAQTARPSLSSQRTATFTPTSANLNLSRTRSHPSPKSFLKLSNRNLPPLPPKPDHYSFFDDSDAPYPRSQSSLSRTRLRVHTRLPALHKSRSQMPSIFTKKSAVSDLGCAPRSSYYYAQSCTDLSYNIEDPRCPSPFTSPREAPKPPTFEDSDDLEVPDFVFERRGSATSENTMSSTRTTSTLAERLSNAFPISWHLPFSSKSRSKLHLSIASSSHSSPSSSSSHSTSYGSPITPLFQAGYSFPPNVEISQVGTGYGVPIDADIHNFSETEAEALAIGRVLTPEEDPFAKPEINVEDTTTPRPLGYNRYSNQGVCIRDLRRGSAQSEVVPRQRYGVDRMYSTPVFSRSLEPDDFPHALVAANYSFPPSCTVHTSLSPISSSSGLPPSPSVRSFRSREEYNLPPSSWSAWSSPVTVESTCLPSTESSNSDVRVADFPLPPPSIAGLPLGCPAELDPRLSYSVPVSPTSPTSPFSGLGLSFASEASSPLAGRGTQLPAAPIPVRARRRERESFRSLRSLPPILSAYEPEES
ncbi:hypothetical protein QCA50_001336 [Cerrena zonata]|uniref:Proteophosphoglycan ppg4 n=1 Tax=Cerrena zonata TaxID=2478898 RepID=A0AAW0GX08_9APHY